MPSYHQAQAGFPFLSILNPNKRFPWQVNSQQFFLSAKFAEEPLACLLFIYFILFFSVVPLFSLDCWYLTVTNFFRAFGIHMFCPPPLYTPQRFPLLVRKCFGPCDTNSEVTPCILHGCALSKAFCITIPTLASSHFHAVQMERPHCSVKPAYCFLDFLHRKTSFLEPCEVHEIHRASRHHWFVQY